MELGDIIANNVRAERVRRGLTQQGLADRLGWDRTSIGHLERGRRNVIAGDLPLLCRALGCTLDVLMFGASREDLAAMGVRQIVERPDSGVTQ